MIIKILSPHWMTDEGIILDEGDTYADKFR